MGEYITQTYGNDLAHLRNYTFSADRENIFVIVTPNHRYDRRNSNINRDQLIPIKLKDLFNSTSSSSSKQPLFHANQNQIAKLISQPSSISAGSGDVANSLNSKNTTINQSEYLYLLVQNRDQRAMQYPIHLYRQTKSLKKIDWAKNHEKLRVNWNYDEISISKNARRFAITRNSTETRFFNVTHPDTKKEQITLLGMEILQNIKMSNWCWETNRTNKHIINGDVSDFVVILNQGILSIWNFNSENGVPEWKIKINPTKEFARHNNLTVSQASSCISMKAFYNGNYLDVFVYFTIKVNNMVELAICRYSFYEGDKMEMYERNILEKSSIFTIPLKDTVTKEQMDIQQKIYENYNYNK